MIFDQIWWNQKCKWESEESKTFEDGDLKMSKSESMSNLVANKTASCTRGQKLFDYYWLYAVIWYKKFSQWHEISFL